MREASLIISHAGAGSILEGMRIGAAMVVVVNDTLMHNHQEELAGELHERQHLLATTPGGLLGVLTELHTLIPTLQPMPAADETAFAHFLGKELGLAR
jgi:beta-1,4-N-acetylglucosaminyltransferase